MTEKKTPTRRKKPAAPKLDYYRTVKAPLHHPYANILIPTSNPGVPLEVDSWLECQIERGLVVKV